MPKLTHALIIDDDAFNLEVLARLLDGAKIAHTAIQDPSQLDAAIAQTAQFDIVFLDLEMPHMDGYQAFSFLRNRLGTSIPVVACTVHVNEAPNARELGFHSFISKPLDPSRFSEQLARIANGEQVWDY